MTDLIKRPSLFDKDTISEVAKQLLPDLMKWGSLDLSQRDEILEDITEVLQDVYEFDGYRLAKKCEDELHWEADSRLVCIMDGVYQNARVVTSKKIKEWVKTRQRTGVGGDVPPLQLLFGMHAGGYRAVVVAAVVV